MKKIFTLVTLAFFAFQVKAQISSFPATEGFEATFTTGTNIQFIPNWTGSDVRPSASPARIFADLVNQRTGLQALGAIPTSTVNDTITVSLDLTTVANLTFSFWARTDVNGSGDRQAIVYCSTSIDGGVTYSAPAQVGDSTSFPNLTTPYANYSYFFPPNTNNQANVLMRMVVSRGNGNLGGTTARFIMDDASFTASTVDIFPPDAVGATASSTTTVEVAFNEPVNNTADNTSNYTFLPGVVSAVRNGSNDKVTLTLSPALTEGQFYSLTVSNIQDIAGNTMTTPRSFSVIFNDNTGNVKITEINYNDPAAGIDSLEYIEIKNLDGNSIDIGGWKFTQGISYTFPSGSQILAGQYLVFSKFASYIQTYYGVSSTEWDIPSGLNNSGGESLTLYNAAGVLIDSTYYNSVLPYDTLANGWGHSLVLCDESSDNDQPGNWAASYDAHGTYIGVPIFGSPGGPCVTVGINENKRNDFALSAYPNPANDLMEVIFNSDMHGRYTVQVVDMAGRVINSVERMAYAGENTFSMPVTTLDAGIYLLVISGADGQSQLRFAKQ